MGVLHGNRDRVEPPGPNLVKSRDPLADPICALNIRKFVLFTRSLYLWRSWVIIRKYYEILGDKIAPCRTPLWKYKLRYYLKHCVVALFASSIRAKPTCETSNIPPFWSLSDANLIEQRRAHRTKTSRNGFSSSDSSTLIEIHTPEWSLASLTALHWTSHAATNTTARAITEPHIYSLAALRNDDKSQD